MDQSKYLELIDAGLPEEERAYLAAGGQGFIVGEVYYCIAVPKYHAAISPDYQPAVNLADNRDRSGLVHMVALRLYVKFQE